LTDINTSSGFSRLILSSFPHLPDQALPVATTAVLALNARAAWAHDWVTNPSLTPVFQALPGASFIVNGATPVSDSALLSAGGELRFLNGWAIGGLWRVR